MYDGSFATGIIQAQVSPCIRAVVNDAHKGNPTCNIYLCSEDIFARIIDCSSGGAGSEAPEQG